MNFEKCEVRAKAKGIARVHTETFERVQGAGFGKAETLRVARVLGEGTGIARALTENFERA
jgi:molybdenum cofactor biosynthesis enzyme